MKSKMQVKVSGAAHPKGTGTLACPTDTQGEGRRTGPESGTPLRAPETTGGSWDVSSWQAGPWKGCKKGMDGCRQMCFRRFSGAAGEGCQGQRHTHRGEGICDQLWKPKLQGLLLNSMGVGRWKSCPRCWLR